MFISYHTSYHICKSYHICLYHIIYANHIIFFVQIPGVFSVRVGNLTDEVPLGLVASCTFNYVFCWTIEHNLRTFIIFRCSIFQEYLEHPFSKMDWLVINWHTVQTVTVHEPQKSIYSCFSMHLLRGGKDLDWVTENACRFLLSCPDYDVSLGTFQGLKSRGLSWQRWTTPKHAPVLLRSFRWAFTQSSQFKWVLNSPLRSLYHLHLCRFLCRPMTCDSVLWYHSHLRHQRRFFQQCCHFKSKNWNLYRNHVQSWIPISHFRVSKIRHHSFEFAQQQTSEDLVSTWLVAMFTEF